MSYILEALKKSEQERKQGGVPNIQSVHAGGAAYDDPDESDNSGIIKLFILAVAFAFLGGGGFMLYHYFSDDGGTVQGQVAQVPDSSISLPLPAPKNPIEDKKDPLPQPKAVAPVQHKPVVKPAPQKAEPESTPKVVFSDKPLDLEPEPISEQELEQAGSISQLPDSIRKNLPDITFTGHVYSQTPKRRSVVLNGKKLREGNALNGELVLRAITPEGAILSFQGRLFKMQALQDWSR